MNDAWGSRESEDLFRSAKHALTPSTADRDRMRARLAMKIGATAAAVSIATTTSKAAAATKAASIPLLAKIIAPIVIVSAVAGGGAVVGPRVIESRRSHATPTVAATSAAKPTAVVSPSSKNAAPSSEEEASPAVSVSINDLPNAKGPLKKGSKTSHGANKNDVVATASEDEAARDARDEEAALVAEIDAALRSGDTARASRLADDHQRRFPNGLLVEEREGARVLVRCASTPNAKLAGDFLKAHPRSPMRSRIIAACGTNTN